MSKVREALRKARERSQAAESGTPATPPETIHPHSDSAAASEPVRVEPARSEPARVAPPARVEQPRSDRSEVADAPRRARTGGSSRETLEALEEERREVVREAQRRKRRPRRPTTKDTQFVSSLDPETVHYYEAIGKQIEVALGDLATRNLVFTGAVEGDGTSTVIAQYGEMLARRGDRVLIIDGNPRNPTLHEKLNVPEAPGIAEFISQNTPRDAVIHETGQPRLHLIPLGRCHDRSHAEQITERLAHVQTEFLDSYDYVLIDTAFIGSPFFSRAAVSEADGVVLVLRSGKTNRQIAGRACDVVRRTGGRILGVVLNRREFPIPDFIYRRL